MYEINSLCNKVCGRSKSLSRLASIFIKMGSMYSLDKGNEVYSISNTVKKDVCKVLISYLSDIKDDVLIGEKVVRILDHNELINQNEVIIGNYIEIMSTLSRQYKCMSISANTIFQLHIRLLGFTNEIIGWRTGSNAWSNISDVDDVSNEVLKYCNEYEKIANQSENCIISTFNLIMQIILINPFNNYNEMIICLLTRLLFYKTGYARLINCNLEKVVMERRREIKDVINNFITSNGENYDECLEVFSSILLSSLDSCVVVDNAISIKSIIRKLGKEFTDQELQRYCIDSSITKIRNTLNEMMSNGEVSCFRDGSNILWRKTSKFSDAEDSSRRGDKTKVVLDTIRSMKGAFCFADLHSSCRNVSSITIRKVLESEKKQGRIVCCRKGRSSSWQKVS